MDLRLDLQLFVIVRFADGQAECATWQVRDGGQALALFSTHEQAEKYRQMAGLSNEWNVVRPPRSGLLELLRVGQAQEMILVVVDPDDQKAHLALKIADVLASVDSLGNKPIA